VLVSADFHSRYFLSDMAAIRLLSALREGVAEKDRKQLDSNRIILANADLQVLCDRSTKGTVLVARLSICIPNAHSEQNVDTCTAEPPDMHKVGKKNCKLD